jgi:hypothetical protein
VTVITVRRARLKHYWASATRRDQRTTEEPKMTASFTKTIRQTGLMLAFAVSVAALSPTSSFAFSAEAQRMCTGDAFRLCASDIPNIPAVTACMVKQRASLSAGCRVVMDKEMSQQSNRVATK